MSDDEFKTMTPDADEPRADTPPRTPRWWPVAGAVLCLALPLVASGYVGLMVRVFRLAAGV